MPRHTTILRQLKRRIVKRSSSRLEIILYHLVSDEEDVFTKSGHNVRPGVFGEQIRYLNDHFNVVPLRQVRQILSQDGSSSGPYACVCFDDGYLSNLTEAYPILEELKTHATVFVCPSVLDNQDLLWRDEVRYLIEKDMVDDFVGYLQSGENADKYRFEVLERKRFYAWSKDRDAITDMSLQEDLRRYFLDNGTPPSDIAKQYGLFMDRSDVRSREYLDFGNHTWSHPLMTLLDYERQRTEILRAHEHLAEAGASPFALAMPFSPFNDDTVRICREIGYDFVLTAENRSTPLDQGSEEDVVALHRRLAPPTLKKLKKIV